MNIFHAQDYRLLLRERLLEKKAQFGRLFTFEKMARACRLQRTYLSTVLGGTGHLNGDQFFAACEFLQFSDEEYAFAALLHEWDRSQSAPRRKKLMRELEEKRAAGLKTDNYIAGRKNQSLAPFLDEFYLDLQAQMVHMFLTIPRFQRDFEGICRHLGMEKEAFAHALNKIEKAGLIALNGTQVRILQDSIHLPATSHLFPNYRMQMRLKALEHMQTRSANSHYSFSVLFSGSEETRRKIHARFLEFISWCQKVSADDRQENVYQLNFDLLRWS